MSTTNVGLMPGAAGVQQLGTTPIGNIAPYGGPYVAPQLMSQERLQNQTQIGDIAQSTVQAQMMALGTASSMRQEISGTAHGIANQAISQSQAQIGDEIGEAKKSIDNASKAV